MRQWFMVAVALGVIVTVSVAREKGELERRSEELRREAERLEQQIEELHLRREALAREAEELERGREAEEYFARIKDESRERLKHLETKLVELHEMEREGTPAQRQFREVCIDHLKARMRIERKLLALPDSSALPAAERLLRELESIDARWEMVIEPRHEGALAIAEMEAELRELGRPPELVRLLEQVEQLYKHNLAVGERLYKAWIEREELALHLDELTEQFWRAVERAEEGER